MSEKKNLVVLYNQVEADTPEDVLDNRTQAFWIAEILAQSDYRVSTAEFTAEKLLDLKKTVSDQGEQALLILNMVDATPGQADLVYRLPALLNDLQLPYTGCSCEALYLTTDKIKTKEILRESGISTPEWVSHASYAGFCRGQQYIIKAVSEDASIGLTEDSVVNPRDARQLEQLICEREKRFGRLFFAERYIDGREFNVCLYGDQDHPIALQPYEWKFEGYEALGMARIFDYAAKWEEQSYGYDHVTAVYDLAGEENLLRELEEIALQCWRIFGLRGHARIDFRIDAQQKPWVLEINGNPSYYGFYHIARHKGLDFQEIVRAIVEAV
ncbi:MAG: D-alanine--D-alanine ligase [Negativicutes bacterium]|nr:D-alanine--D-alanine ligase [Negativicutes bacterium]